MDLSNIKKDSEYRVESISSSSEDIVSRFLKLGIIPGCKIALKRKAPIFKDPLLFDVDGTQVVLTKNESKLVKIKVL